MESTHYRIRPGRLRQCGVPPIKYAVLFLPLAESPITAVEGLVIRQSRTLKLLKYAYQIVVDGPSSVTDDKRYYRALRSHVRKSAVQTAKHGE
jgi:hypothetical protein